MSPFDRAHMTSYWRSIHSNYGSISCRWWHIHCRKMSWLWKPSQRSFSVIKSGTIR